MDPRSRFVSVSRRQTELRKFLSAQRDAALKPAVTEALNAKVVVPSCQKDMTLMRQLRECLQGEGLS